MIGKHQAISFFCSCPNVKLKGLRKINVATSVHSHEGYDNPKLFIENAASKLNIKQMSDWYNVTLKVIRTNLSCNLKDLTDIGGRNLLKDHKQSPALLLSTAYPDHEWMPWKFVKCPQNFWNSPEKQKQFVDWVYKELNFKSMSEWYNISAKVTKKIVFIFIFLRILLFWEVVVC
jgi:hypothetical protein